MRKIYYRVIDIFLIYFIILLFGIYIYTYYLLLFIYSMRILQLQKDGYPRVWTQGLGHDRFVSDAQLVLNH